MESIEGVREQSDIQEEYVPLVSLPPISLTPPSRAPARRWFGLILLPILSFSGDGIVAICNFLRRAWAHLHRALHRAGARATAPGPDELEPLASEFAHGRPIDLSIQFTLWWMPFIVLLGWWIGKPMHLLFGKPRSYPVVFQGKADMWSRLFRSRAVTRLMLPRELHHCGREDELGRGPHHGLLLCHDREFLPLPPLCAG